MPTPAEILASHGYLPDLGSQGVQDFIAACKDGLVEVVEAFLDLGVSVNATREISREPALGAACEGGHAAVVELLLARGADIEQRDGSDDTPLRTAVNWDRPELVRLLRARGADIEAVSRHDESALAHAVREDKDVALLLELGADPNLVRNGRSAVHTAIFRDKLEALRVLLDAGASLRLVLDEHGVTPLHEAVRGGTAEHVALLLERGAPIDVPDAYGLTPLDYALELDIALPGAPAAPQVTRATVWKHVAAGELADALAAIERGDVSVETRDARHATPIVAFARAGHREGVARLLARGANPAPPGSETAVSAALAGGHADVVADLVTAGAPIFDAAGELPGASTAVWEGHTEALARVIARCTPDEIPRFAGNVFAAVMQHRADVIDLFVRHGVPLEGEPDRRESPLVGALASWYDGDIARRLLDGGASISAVDRNGDTPLHEHVGRYDWDASRAPTLRLLVERGAPLDVMNWQHQTPYGAARDEAKAVLRQILVEEPLAAGTPIADLAKRHSWATLPMFVDAGRSDLVTALIDAGVSPVAPPHGADILSHVIGHEPLDLALVRELVRRGLPVDHRSSYEMTPLHAAVGTESAELVELLLDAGADVRAVDQWGSTVMHYAKSVPMLELLAARGAEIDRAASPPLIGAVRHEGEAFVRFFLDRGVRLDARGRSGETALTVAITRPSEPLALLLIAAGASTSLASRETGDPPLAAAAKLGQVEVVRALLERGADLDAKTRSGETALELIVRRKALREALAAQLAERGIDVVVPAVTPLPAELVACSPEWAAVYGRDRGAVVAAVDQGRLPVDARDPWGTTPLMVAVLRKDVELVRALLDRGANIAATDAAGNQPWDYGGFWQRNAELDALLTERGSGVSMDRLNGQAARSMLGDELKAALDRGELAKIAAMLRERRLHAFLGLAGHSPLLDAIDRDDEDLLGVLLDLGLRPDASTLAFALGRRRTAHAARLVRAGAPVSEDALGRALEEGGDDALVGWLIEHGADLRRVDDRGRLPIHLAAASGQAGAIAQMLARDRTLVDARDGEGRTPLAAAADAHQGADAIPVLLAAGAAPDAADAEGRTALYWAVDTANEDAARLLLAGGATWTAVARDHLGVMDLGDDWPD